MDRYPHSRDTESANADETGTDVVTQEILLQRILAAISECRPDKCVVLEARHVPATTPGFAALSS